MNLGDILQMCNEYQVVKIFDLEGNELAEYDGKNSIDEKYNNIEVRLLTGRNYGIDIMLQCIIDDFMD